MRLVIDTNIWVSGLLWQGKAWSLLKLAEQGEIEICIAYPMLLELEEGSFLRSAVMLFLKSALLV